MKDLVKHMQIDDRLDAYRPFFDHQWAQKLFAIVSESPELELLVFDLTLAFKGVSTTAAMPLLAVNMTESYAKGVNLHSLSNSDSLRLVNLIAGQLEAQVFFLATLQKAQVANVMRKIALQFTKSVEGKSVPFPRQELWDSFVTVKKGEEKDNIKNEFRLSLWSSSRICYSSLFFAYEDFIVRCLAIHKGEPVRSTDKKFNKKCRESFGDLLTEKCWLHQKIIDAKYIRHALAHAGGKETKDLKDRNHDISVVEGKLQIVQGDVVALYNLLEDRVTAIAEWAAKEAAFQTSTTRYFVSPA